MRSAEEGEHGEEEVFNGPEFSSRHFLAWNLERGINVVHIELGMPVQNLQVESFHGRLREECLNASRLGNLFEARAKITAWEDYGMEGGVQRRAAAQ